MSHNYGLSVQPLAPPPLLHLKGTCPPFTAPHPGAHHLSSPFSLKYDLPIGITSSIQHFVLGSDLTKKWLQTLNCRQLSTKIKIYGVHFVDADWVVKMNVNVNLLITDTVHDVRIMSEWGAAVSSDPPETQYWCAWKLLCCITVTEHLDMCSCFYFSP